MHSCLMRFAWASKDSDLVKWATMLEVIDDVVVESDELRASDG